MIHRATDASPAALVVRIGRRKLILTWRPRKRVALLLQRLLIGAWRAIFGVLAMAGASGATLAGPVLPAGALPSGGQLLAGHATITQAGNVMNVTQGSDKAILQWSSFNIGSQAAVNFQQPASSSVILNRVAGNDPSQLQGTMTSNGKVWLINPAGIMVGQGARIDLGGFVAGTLQVRNEDFLAGRLNFRMLPNAGRIENHGSITTPAGGSVYLVAPNVENNGIIHAPGGEVILAAGQSVQLIDTGTPGVKVQITGAEGNVTNLGSIISEAGRIGMAGVLVHNSGSLNVNGVANTVVSEGGRIFLRARQDSYVEGEALITAGGSKGGSIEVLGNRVALTEHALLDASGVNGGGSVLVGGDYQGKNDSVQNAARTYVGPATAIRANAIARGDGGKVIVWADVQTRFYGDIAVNGGAVGGNGGFVETSGKIFLTAAGRVSASAPSGQGGTWLLDPDDLEIVSGGNAHITNTPGENTPDLPHLFAGNGEGNSTLETAVLGAALHNGATVNVQTGSSAGGSGTITVSTAIQAIGSGTLNLNAQKDIIITTNGSIAGHGSDALHVNLNAGTGSDHLTAGANTSFIAMQGDSFIHTGGGDLSATANFSGIALRNIVTGGALSVTSNGGPISQGGPWIVGGTTILNAGANTITLQDSGNLFSGPVHLHNSGMNNVDFTNGTDLILASSSLGSGNTTIIVANSGEIILPALTLSGNLAVSAGSIVITDNIQTTGHAQTYSGPVTLYGTNATRTLSGNSMTFDGSITGGTDKDENANILNLVNTGTASFNGAVGSGVMLKSLYVSGPVYIGGGSVATSGTQTYSGAAILGNDTTLSGSGIMFNSTLDSKVAHNYSLTVNDSGATTFGDATGASRPLGDLIVNSGDSITTGSITALGSVHLSTPGELALGGALIAASAPESSVVLTGALISGGNPITSGGDITATATGSNGSIVLGSLNAGTSSISLDAAGADADVTTGSITLQSIALGGASAANLGSLTVHAGRNIALGFVAGNSEAHAVSGVVGNAGNAASMSLTADNGSISVGQVNLDSYVCTTGFGCSGGSASGNAGNGGAVIMSAPNGSITVSGPLDTTSFVQSTGGTTGSAGSISMDAGGDISTGTLRSLIFGVGATSMDGQNAGDIGISTRAGSVTLGAVDSRTFGNGLNGSLTVRSIDGAISQSGSNVWLIGGASDLSATRGAISLPNANHFSGALSVSNSGAHDITINDAGSLTLDAATLDKGSLVVTAGGQFKSGGTLTTRGGNVSITASQIGGTTDAPHGADINTFIVGATGNDLAPAGNVTLVATSGGITIDDITAIGSSGRNSGESGPKTRGGNGGVVSLSAGGDILLDAILTSGGAGSREASVGGGSQGGDAGPVALIGTGSTMVVSNNKGASSTFLIAANGGNGGIGLGSPGNGGNGGAGAAITIQTSNGNLTVNHAFLNASGGNGAVAGTSGSHGIGGAGADVTLGQKVGSNALTLGGQLSVSNHNGSSGIVGEDSEGEPVMPAGAQVFLKAGSGAITQAGGATISANKLAIDTLGSVTLDLANSVSYLSGAAAGGLTVYGINYVGGTLTAGQDISLRPTGGGTGSLSILANVVSSAGNILLVTDGLDIYHTSLVQTTPGEHTVTVRAYSATQPVVFNSSTAEDNGAGLLLNARDMAAFTTSTLIIGAASAAHTGAYSLLGSGPFTAPGVAGTLKLINQGSFSQGSGSFGFTLNGLDITAVGGINLSHLNHVNSFKATNTGSGNIVFTTNSGSNALAIGGISDSVGSITLDNTGATSILGPVSGSGEVTLNAHSPLNISSSISAGTLLSLSASTDININSSAALHAGSGVSATTSGGSINAASGATINVGSGSIAFSAPSGTITSAATFSGATPTLSALTVVDSGSAAQAAAAAAAAAQAAADAAAAATQAAADAAAKAAADAAAKAAADAATKAAADAATKAAADTAAKVAADATAAKEAADAAAKTAADAAAKVAADAAAKTAADAAAKVAADAAAKVAADAAAKVAADAAAKAAADAAVKAAADAAVKAAADAATKAAADAAAKVAADAAAAKAATDAAAQVAAAAAAKAAADTAARAAAELAAKAVVAAETLVAPVAEAPKTDTTTSTKTQEVKTSEVKTQIVSVATTPTPIQMSMLFEQQTIGGGDNSFGSAPPPVIVPATSLNVASNSNSSASSNSGTGTGSNGSAGDKPVSATEDKSASKTDDKKDAKDSKIDDKKEVKKDVKKLTVCR